MNARKWWFASSGLALLAALLTLTYLSSLKPVRPQAHSISPANSPTPFSDPRIQTIDKALQEAIARHKDVIAFLIYQVRIHQVDFSEDGRLALVWLELIEPESGQIVPAEAGLAIAKLQDDQSWQIILQSDPTWTEELNQVPDNMLSAELKQRYLPGEQAVPKEHLVFSGYKLPWEGGLSKRVSGSIGHVFTYKTCPSTCLYAFDFADGTMFPVLAAKGGRVKYAVWRYPNDTHKNANFLVLEDTSTHPTTYQIYYHLAQDSIPPALRIPGAEVLQGQFIGVADNTGPSTGHHLHFMVHTNPGGYWGTSVDITFDEVAVNGGRPRTCEEAKLFPQFGAQCQSGNLYTSDNGDHERPTGGIDQPAQNAVITSRNLVVSGWAKDDGKGASIQPIITWDGNWQTIGSPIKSDHFKVNLDLCKFGVPDGIFFVALRIADDSGKTSNGPAGMTALTKQYECNPTPTPSNTPLPTQTATATLTPSPTPVRCQPASNQVGIFAGPDFSGPCKLLKIGEYRQPASFGKIGDNNLESIKVGSGVVAILYPEPDLQGQKEILLQDAPNLSNHPIGKDQVSSLIVRKRPPLPAPPQAMQMVKDPGTNLVTLSWQKGSGAVEFHSELNGPQGLNQSMEWQKSTTWQPGVLPPGSYTWTVWARNLVGESQASLEFTIETPSLPPVAHLQSLPAELEMTTILLKWVVEEYGQEIQTFNIQYNQDRKGWQDWSKALEGKLRQAWFVGQAGSSYQFRIRAVDITGNVGAFSDQAEAATHISLDCQKDAFEDDDGPVTSRATPIEVNQSQQHNLCGFNDQDWLLFPAKVGRTYHIRTDPLGNGVAVTIQLYSGDGRKLLGEEKPASLGQPAELSWNAPADAVYAVRLSGLQSGLSGTQARYQVKIDEVVKIYPQAVLCSSLLLPLVWGMVKGYQKLRRKW